MRFWNSLILLLFITLFLTCSKNNKQIISQRKLASILVDIHLADEIGLSRHFAKEYFILDSTTLYRWVFEKHSITMAQFDSSVSYYATKADALNKIYKNVSDRISRMEAEIARAEEEASKKTIIYEDKKLYRLPLEGEREKLPIDVPLTGEGEYTVNARIIMQRIDQSVNPHITAYYWYDNGTEEGARDYFKSAPIKKSDRPNMYSVSKNLTDTLYTHLRGYILDHDNTDTTFVKNAVVMKIWVTK